MGNEATVSPAQFQEFLEAELNSIRGLWYPVKPLLLTRLLVRHARVNKLHPNPDDEFCDPKIGPHYGIIAKYEREMRRDGLDTVSSGETEEAGSSLGEPLEVQKIRPDGYMILNGHHRWAAACRIGIRRLPIHIVSLTQKEDIENMLLASRHDRRVTFDLEETVFDAFPGDENGFEKPLPFFLRRAFPQKIRRGVPALFRFLASHGYDVWVYTARYYSLDRLRMLFACYSSPVVGVITGAARRGPFETEVKETLKPLIDAKYQSTIHVDSESVLMTSSRSKDFVEIPLDLSAASWSQAVMDAFSRLDEARPSDHQEKNGL